MQQDEVFLSSGKVRKRYGNVSKMWLYRRAKAGDFPRPVLIGGRKFYRISELLEYERGLPVVE